MHFVQMRLRGTRSTPASATRDSGPGRDRSVAVIHHFVCATSLPLGFSQFWVLTRRYKSKILPELFPPSYQLWSVTNFEEGAPYVAPLHREHHSPILEPSVCSSQVINLKMPPSWAGPASATGLTAWYKQKQRPQS